MLIVRGEAQLAVPSDNGAALRFGTARKLYSQGRISPDETTVLCITGNGLKTTDALAGKYQAEEPIAPKVAEFEKYMERTLNASPKDVPETVEV